jgi:diguanylate cyclase (GGDEF)-like protein/PAS domain S-box-containing protein
MQGPAIHLVLLGLLILFFGMQQHGRARPAFRFWFVGWVFIFLSYVVWERGIAGAPVTVLSEAVRVDLLLLGGLSFLFSFAKPTGGLRQTVLFLAATWVAASAGYNIELLKLNHLWVDVLLVVVGEGMGAWAAWVLLPERLRNQRLPLLILCVVFGAGLILAARNGGSLYMESLVLMQVFESVAVLYAGASTAGRMVRTAGFVGFAAWALWYPMADLLQTRPETLRMFYEFWDLPKYMVAFAMTLEIFEDSRLEVSHIADEYKTLYEDFYLLYDKHPHPMWIYEPQSRRFLSANRATVETYGYREDELLTMTVDQMEAPLAMERMPTARTAAETVPSRRIHQHKSGAMVSVELTDGNILFQGQPARVVLAVDVTERDKFDQEMFHRAHHDELTGLPNRQLLEDRAHQCLARSERDGKRAVLLTIDVDHFKQVNDTYGHMTGDECLKAVAVRLQSRIRQVDTVARTGGEEFTAIIGGLSSAEDAEKIARTLLAAFESPMQLPDCALPLTISIGVAVFPDDGGDYATLRRLSDDALYRAKHGGRNRAAFAAQSTAVRRPFAEVN